MSGENCKQISLAPQPQPPQPQPQQPQPQPQPQVFPGTLQGVLNWTVQNTAEHLSKVALEAQENNGAAGAVAAAESEPAAVTAMDPERRRFLDEVFKQFSQDPFEGLKKHVAKLKNKDATLEDKIEALESIQDDVEDLNIAEVLHSTGGLVPVVSFLNPEAPEELQWRAADIIASITQNFPKVQELVAPFKVVARLVVLLSPQSSEKVRAKALRALSCVSRGNEALTQQCLAEPHFRTYVCDCVESPSEHLQIKASHLLRHFLTASALATVSGPAIGSLVRALERNTHESSAWEHAMGALADASGAHPPHAALIREDHAALRDILAQRVAYIKAKEAADQDAHLEELEHAQKLESLFA